MFEETHRLALSLVREGLVDGLRIDHPDGLADPAGYLERLRDAGVRARLGREDPRPRRAAARLAGRGHGRLRVPQRRGGAVRRPRGRGAADRAVGRGLRRPAAVRRGRRRGQARAGRDDVRARRSSACARLHDRRRPRRGAGLAARLPHLHPRRPRSRPRTREVLREAGLEWLPEAPPEFVTRFQQTTPPVMAKGVEDTAFYRYGRLLALNDVGGDPSRFGISVEAFHAGNRERAERFPRNLLVTQTHDTKRSGDVRARIGALAGMAEEWEAHVRTWLVAAWRTCPGRTAPSATSSSRRSWAPGRSSPSGSRPTSRRRCARPSATTNWIEPDEAHEAAVKAFCRALYEHEAFLRRLRAVRRRGRARGRARGARPAAAQADRAGHPRHLQRRRAALALAVDPDNRRPVDWDARRAALAALRRRRRAGPRDAQAARHPARAGAAGAAAGGVRGRLHAGRRRRGRCARSRAARARCSSSCRCAAPRRARR